jgi:hypothetical protein
MVVWGRISDRRQLRGRDWQNDLHSSPYSILPGGLQPFVEERSRLIGNEET